MSAGDLRAQLHADEAVEGSVEAGANQVLVTGRRILAYTPGGDGANFRAVDRPNVEDVTVRTRSDRGYLAWAGVAVVAGALLLGGWVLFDAAGLFPASTGRGASALGVGGIVGEVKSWLGLLDAAMLWGGGLAVLLAAALTGLYVRSRETVVAVDVAGGPDLDVPTGEGTNPETVADDLRESLGWPPRYETPDRPGG